MGKISIYQMNLFILINLRGTDVTSDIMVFLRPAEKKRAECRGSRAKEPLPGCGGGPPLLSTIRNVLLYINYYLFSPNSIYTGAGAPPLLPRPKGGKAPTLRDPGPFSAPQRKRYNRNGTKYRILCA